MDVIFIQKRLLWHKIQCVHILSLIMHCHTGHVYCNNVLTVHVSIFLTEKHIIIIQTLHHQYSFTFIKSLRAVLLMVYFHLNTRKYVTCIKNHLHQINIQQYSPEKS